jgi:hypothetical protein
MTSRQTSLLSFLIGSRTCSAPCWRPDPKCDLLQRLEGPQAGFPSGYAETVEVAEIEWKGAMWRAAYGALSLKELLTILKGFGPMEILEFEKHGCFKGQISLSLSKDGTKEITLYHLEVEGPGRQGRGRAALQWLKGVFKGELYVQDPGIIRVMNANRESVPFWIRMFREGLIDAMESEWCSLNPGMAENEIKDIEEQTRTVLKSQDQRQGGQ